MMPPNSKSQTRTLSLTVSWATLLKLTVFAALVFLLIKLCHLLGLLLLGLLIAITIAPMAQAVSRRGGPRWLGVAVCAIVVFGTVGLFMFVATPIAAAQISGLIKTLPTIKDHILHHLPESGQVHELASGLLSSPAFANPAPLLQKFMAWGLVAIQGIVEVFIVLVIAVYLVADGPRVFAWLLAFLPDRQKARATSAGEEISEVVFNYMAGQLITSMLCAAYIWGMLSLLHVPNALLLAILGGVLDILPLIGFFLALAPAVAMAATVSSATAGYVVGLYTLYHLVENYFIVPRVYGNKLRLSTLTVLVACMAAAVVGGVIGVIAVLPLIASYPIVERTWLRPVVGPEVVAKHEEIDEKEHAA